MCNKRIACAHYSNKEERRARYESTGRGIGEERWCIQHGQKRSTIEDDRAKPDARCNLIALFAIIARRLPSNVAIPADPVSQPS